MAKETNPYQPILEIKKGNEVFRIHKNDTRFFMVFGAEALGKSNLYELSLTEKEVKSIIKSLS